MERSGFVRLKGTTVHDTVDRDDSIDEETKTDRDVSDAQIKGSFCET